MAGAFSGHLIDSFENSTVSQGNMSFNPSMHGTQQSSQSFSMFGSQGSMAYQELSEATTLKIANLQAKLNQKLGPEYISQRPGPGGGPKLTYAEGWKIINLANDVFGFNGWSSNIVNLTTDFIDVNPETKRCNISVTAIVRVTLRDGVYHEDLGHGLIENAKSKGQGLAKCKKEAVTDAIKRALRNFGNLLGNCLYDKSYAQEVVKIKVPPAKFNPTELHRRPEFDDIKPSVASTSASTSSTHPGPSTTSTSSSASNAGVPRPPHASSDPALVVVKREPPPQSVSFSASSTRRPTPPHNRAMPPPALPPHAQAPQVTDRRVSFTTPSISVAPSTSTAVPLDADDSFAGFSDDDAFLASVDLDGDLGAPIGGEEDVGQPIDADADMGQPLYDNESVASISRPPTPASASIPHSRPGPPPPNRDGSSRSRLSDPGRSSRLEAIIAAQLEQERLGGAQGNNPSSSTSTIASTSAAAHPQAPSRITLPPRNNENRDPRGGQQQSSNSHIKAQAPPVGGFHFPPGMNNPLQGQNHGHAPGSGVGVKRPLDAMANGGQRGARPGMGLQHASGGGGVEMGQNGRQVLGRLDIGESGDVKRMRM